MEIWQKVDPEFKILAPLMRLYDIRLYGILSTFMEGKCAYLVVLNRPNIHPMPAPLACLILPQIVDLGQNRLELSFKRGRWPIV